MWAMGEHTPEDSVLLRPRSHPINTAVLENEFGDLLTLDPEPGQQLRPGREVSTWGGMIQKRQVGRLGRRPLLPKHSRKVREIGEACP